MLEKLRRSMDKATGFWVAEGDSPKDIYRAQVMAAILDKGGHFVTEHVTEYDTMLGPGKRKDLLDKAGTMHITAANLREGTMDLHDPAVGVYEPEFDRYPYNISALVDRKYLTEVNDLSRATRHLLVLPTDDNRKHILFEYAMRFVEQQGVSLSEAVDKVAEILKQTQY